MNGKAHYAGIGSLGHDGCSKLDALNVQRPFCILIATCDIAVRLGFAAAGTVTTADRCGLPRLRLARHCRRYTIGLEAYALRAL